MFQLNQSNIARNISQFVSGQQCSKGNGRCVLSNIWKRKVCTF